MSAPKKTPERRSLPLALLVVVAVILFAVLLVGWRRAIPEPAPDGSRQYQSNRLSVPKGLIATTSRALREPPIEAHLNSDGTVTYINSDADYGVTVPASVTPVFRDNYDVHDLKFGDVYVTASRSQGTCADPRPSAAENAGCAVERNLTPETLLVAYCDYQGATYALSIFVCCNDRRIEMTISGPQIDSRSEDTSRILSRLIYGETSFGAILSNYNPLIALGSSIECLPPSN